MFLSLKPTYLSSFSGIIVMSQKWKRIYREQKSKHFCVHNTVAKEGALNADIGENWG